MGKFFGFCPERSCRRLNDWPEEDRLLWTESLQPGDVIDGGGSRAKYRPMSNRKTEQGYGRWLTFVSRRGFLNQRPADRINRDSVVAYVQEMQQLGNSGYTILARLQELYDAALVMDPNQDWTWIRRIASRIRATTKSIKITYHKLVSSADLLQLGFDLMTQANSAPTPRLGAILFRDGLMIASAALRPLRLSNLATIELSRHLIRQGGHWQLRFAPGEMKNSDPLEMPWPEMLEGDLEIWLNRWRPILCGLRGRWAREIGNALWVSSHGSPLTMQATYDRIVTRTKPKFGHSVNPHLFRDIAATTVADVDPEHVGIAAPLLAHRDFRTTERYYLHASMMKATRRYQAELLRRRHGRKD